MGDLFVCATPIGNLSDISGRALEILKNADLVACEDTRVSLGLMNAYGISSKLVSYHKFNEESKSETLVGELLAGKNIALITDAGTPCISDPGSILVKKAIDAGVRVFGIPGACAAITALSVSGFGGGTFAFYGFLPRKKSETDRLFAEIRKSDVKNHIFYESPLRVRESLKLFAAAFPDDMFCAANDLTKKFERTLVGTSSEVYARLAEDEKAEKGEYVLILHYEREAKTQEEISPEAAIFDRIIKGANLKEAVEAVSDKYSRNSLYAAKLRLEKLLNGTIK